MAAEARHRCGSARPAVPPKLSTSLGKPLRRINQCRSMLPRRSHDDSVRFMSGLMRSHLDSMPEAPDLPAAEDLRAAIGAWLAHMAHELARADNTLVAYERDVRQ